MQSKYGNFDAAGQGADTDPSDDADPDDDIAELTFPIFRGIRYVYARMFTPFNAAAQQQMFGFWHMRCNFYGTGGAVETLPENDVCHIPIILSVYDHAKVGYVWSEMYLEFPDPLLWVPQSQTTGDSPFPFDDGGKRATRLCRAHVDINSYTGLPTTGETFHCFWEVGCA